MNEDMEHAEKMEQETRNNKNGKQTYKIITEHTRK